MACRWWHGCRCFLKLLGCQVGRLNSQFNKECIVQPGEPILQAPAAAEVSPAPLHRAPSRSAWPAQQAMHSRHRGRTNSPTPLHRAPSRSAWPPFRGRGRGWRCATGPTLRRALEWQKKQTHQCARGVPHCGQGIGVRKTQTHQCERAATLRARHWSGGRCKHISVRGVPHCAGHWSGQRHMTHVTELRFRTCCLSILGQLVQASMTCAHNMAVAAYLQHKPGTTGTGAVHNPGCMFPALSKL